MKIIHAYKNEEMYTHFLYEYKTYSLLQQDQQVHLRPEKQFYFINNKLIN